MTPDEVNELAVLLRKELDAHKAHLDKLQKENDQLVRDLNARIADDKAEVKALRDERDRLRDALESIVQWSEAYPLRTFPEPDFARAAMVLNESGMTLDAISASNMRHAISGAGEIARTALGGDDE